NFYYLGASQSVDYDLPGNYNNGEELDYWLFATDSNFNTLWSRNFGGSDPCGDLACEAFRGDILIKNNMLYAFIKNTIPDSLPDFNIECGHESAAGSFPNPDAWLVAFDLTTVEIIEPEITEQPLFEIYPNPADNEITIKNNGDALMYGIVIHDILGNQIYYDSLLLDSTLHLNLFQYPAGFYLLSISSNQKFIASYPLIISH
ncbi:MAG TPA: T9SS type A sorting domain-containing protein, partial [Chitinophagales bacterium]|nr:T9SS type A sorting domain-containing protein [Chitinophagales bacterium]